MSNKIATVFKILLLYCICTVLLLFTIFSVYCRLRYTDVDREV